jgi:ribonuclease BN (tRNA processing enzyme)
VLTHFSQRYDDVSPLVEEAAAVFPNVVAAHDLKNVVV